MKTIMKKSALFTAIVVIGVFIQVNSHISAKTSPDFTSLIKKQNDTMSALLENRSAIQDTIAFLHEHISENAVFEMSMSNETMPKEMLNKSIKMDKTAYINSFIQGTHLIDKYKVSIKTLDVQISPDSKTAISKEIMTEEGVSLNPYNLQEEGKPFISTTSCTTIHKLDNGKAISVKAKCHTDMSFLTSA